MTDEEVEMFWVALVEGQVRFCKEVVAPTWTAVAKVTDDGGAPWQYPKFFPLPSAGFAMVASLRDLQFFLGVVGGIEAASMRLSIEITEAIG